MSRLLRKGAVIDKAALVVVVVGLLLYGAAALVKGQLGSEEQVSLVSNAAETEADALASREITADLPRTAETAEGALETARSMAEKGDWHAAREFYGFASQYGQGETLKAAMCGVARAEAERGGDSMKTVEMAKALLDANKGDEKLAKELLQAGDRLVKNNKRSDACQVYEAIANSLPAGKTGLKALTSLGVAAGRSTNTQKAVEAADRLMSDEYSKVDGMAYSVDLIASALAKRPVAAEAISVYEKLAASATDEKARVIALSGLAAVLIEHDQSDAANPIIASLADASGEITDPVVCGKIGAAYIGAWQFDAAIPYLKRVQAANEGSAVGWGATGKVVECGIRIEADSAVDEALVKMASGYETRADKGKTFFDYARQYMILGRPDRSEAVLRLCAPYLSDKDDKWLSAASIAAKVIAGADPKPLLEELVGACDDKDAPGVLFEVGRAVMFRGMHIRGQSEDASRLMAAGDVFLKYVTDNYPKFNMLASVWYTRGECAHNLNDEAAALEYAMTAVKTDPAYKYVASCYELAVTACNDLVHTSPDGAKVATARILELCKEARAACPDDPGISNMVDTCERVYGKSVREGGVQ